MCICYNVALHADPYLNTDAGTMSPFEHGEVFVLDDGGEVRMHYAHAMRMLSLVVAFIHGKQIK